MDVCRQSIVFECVHDIITCLQFIERDNEAVVIRIKNRLNSLYDSSTSAGYRDVALNMRIMNPETVGLGIETHVCELQLLLRPFAELKVRRNVFIFCNGMLKKRLMDILAE